MATHALLHFLDHLSFRTSMLLALMTGAVNVLAFAPFFLWPLQILSLALVLLLVLRHPQWNKKQNAGIGFAYGFGFLFVGVSWLLIVMIRYGHIPSVLAVLALILFVSYLAMFSTLALTMCVAIQRRWQLSMIVTTLLVFPACWTLSEILRGIVFTGFPWLSSGYAHSVSVLAGYAAVLGVYGVGWINAMIVGALVLFCMQKESRLMCGSAIVGFFVVGFGLSQIQWTQAHGKEISVRMLQGNIDQGVKFDMDFLDHTLRLYGTMISEAPADLIATPETALPILTSQLPTDYLPSLQTFSNATQSHVVLGVAIDDGNSHYTNSVLGLRPAQLVNAMQTQTAYRYDKHHLVPFGEFVPYGFRWFVNMMRIPLGDLSERREQQAAMQVKDQLVLPNICYEDLFGGEIAEQLRTQAQSKEGAATILLNVSNLAWYGDSIAIPQHLQISQMRVFEMGRPMLRSTNSGATAVINASGKITAQLPALTQASLSAKAQGMQGLTPYIRWGDTAIYLIVLSALGMAILVGRRFPI